MRASAGPHQYERFSFPPNESRAEFPPAGGTKAVPTWLGLIRAKFPKPDLARPDPERREYIQLKGMKFYRGLRWIQQNPGWPRHNSDLAWELKRLV